MQTRSPLPSEGGRSGFTLIELLVTISIIAVLAGLALPVFQRSMVNTRRIKGLSNLKQAGVAIMTYASEHNATLPGPCALGVVPAYNSSGIASGTLAAFLAPYLGMPEASSLTGGSSNYKVVPALLSPGMVAWNPAMALSTNKIPHFIQSDVLKGNTASGGIGTVRPFGAVDAGGNTDPLRLTRLGDFAINNVAAQNVQVWLLSDVDQQSTDSQARASGWFTSLSPKPVYLTSRLRVYADGHAGAAGLDEL